MVDIEELPKVTDAPENIWLIYGDLERTCSHQEVMRDGEVLWAENEAEGVAVKYVRADSILAKLEAAQRLRRTIGDYIETPRPETDLALAAALAAFDKEQTE